MVGLPGLIIALPVSLLREPRRGGTQEQVIPQKVMEYGVLFTNRSFVCNTLAMAAMTFAVNIFFIHALGDAVSPTLLGCLSDLWGLREALLVTPVAIAIAAGFCFLGKKYIAADMARAEE